MSGSNQTLKKQVQAVWPVFLFLMCFVTKPLLSQEQLIVIGDFQPFQSPRDVQLNLEIKNRLKSVLETHGYSVQISDSDNPADYGGHIFISGYYEQGRLNLNLYGQIYDAETGMVIDALNESDRYEAMEGVRLDPDEIREADHERIDQFVKRIAVRVRSNPNKKTRRLNIDENLTGHPVGKADNFRIAEEDENEASGEVFDLLASSDITVASNVARAREQQPVSVTVIQKLQIQLSGARTLNEVLHMYVPGFFLVEDQDDVIAGFRGLAPDNNAKVLMLLNGHNMNTEWFWGPPDSLLQGISLDYIERIEVIRGPGSVTLGQGALLGVINIVTKTGKTFPKTRLTAGAGKDQYQLLHLQAGAKGQYMKDLSTYVYLSRVRYRGQRLRNEAYAKEKGYEGTDDIRSGRFFDYDIKPVQNIDDSFESVVTGANGLPVFQQNGFALVERRTVYTSGNRLKKSDNVTMLGTIDFRGLRLDGFYTDQSRDLYNFYRDRNEIRNILKAANGSYSFDLTGSAKLKVHASYTEDDVILSSHSGRIMGGTREQRYGGGMLLNLETSRNNKMAIGGEYRKYDMGLGDTNGNNFIVNKADDTLTEPVNETHQYVYNNTIDVGSFFIEDYYSITGNFDIFAAVRYDKQRYWGANFSPRLGTIYRFDKDLRFRLSYQEGFRGSPGVAYSGGFQKDGHLRTDNFDNIETASIPNPEEEGYYRNIPETKPEKMRSYELAANWQISSAWNLDAVAFYNRVSNIIDVGVIYQDPDVFVIPQIGNDEPGDWNGYWFYKNNEGEIRQAGGEFGISYLTGLAQVKLSHSVVRVVSASEQNIGGMYLTEDEENKHFRAYPENISRFSIFYFPFEPLTLSAVMVYYSGWYSPGGDHAEGSALLNLGIQYRFTESMELSLTGKNVLNRTDPYPMNTNAGDRSLTNGSPALEEATWWLTFRYTF